MKKASHGKCLNCGTKLVDIYCSHCGQKILEPSERTFKHFFRQFFGAAFFLENNFLKNLWYLLVRPGFLPKEFIDGRRKHYMPPLSLFLLINFFYFMSVSLTDLNLRLGEQMRQPTHGSLVRWMVDNRLANRSVDLATYTQEYNEQSTSLSKTLIILHVPIFTFFLMLVYWKKKYYFADHLIFATYFVGFVILFSMISSNILKGLVAIGILTSIWSLKYAGLFMLLVAISYLFLAVRKFYFQNYIWTSLKTVSLVVLFIASHFIYRALLFLAVFWTT